MFLMLYIINNIIDGRVGFLIQLEAQNCCSCILLLGCGHAFPILQNQTSITQKEERCQEKRID